jgi:uncharacterized protein YggE
VIDFLKRQGISEDDMKTLDFNIYPKYQWQTTGVDLSIYPNGKRVIVGYEAVESLEVIIRNSDNIGKVIQGSIDAGASQVSNLKFIISNEEVNRIINKARKEAEEILTKNRKVLDKIAKTLIKKETIEREEFERLVK